MQDAIIFMACGIGYAAIIVTSIWAAARWCSPNRRQVIVHTTADGQVFKHRNRVKELEATMQWWNRCN